MKWWVFKLRGKETKVQTTTVTGTETEVERDRYWRRKIDYKEKSDIYIPSRRQDTKLRMEAILSKLVEVQESQETCLKKIKADISEQNKKFESQATAIKQLEQFGLILSIINKRKPGTHPSNIVQNPKNDSIVRPLPLEVERPPWILLYPL